MAYNIILTSIKSFLTKYKFRPSYNTLRLADSLLYSRLMIGVLWGPGFHDYTIAYHLASRLENVTTGCSCGELYKARFSSNQVSHLIKHH